MTWEHLKMKRERKSVSPCGIKIIKCNFKICTLKPLQAKMESKITSLTLGIFLLVLDAEITRSFLKS